jgi:hypothetical protein
MKTPRTISLLTITLAAALFPVSFGTSETALAQPEASDHVPIDAALALSIPESAGPLWTPEDAAELEAIDGQATWATALYVTSAVALAGTPVLWLAAGFIASRDIVATGALVLTGVGVGILSLVTLPFAIALDIDSGLRRDRLADAIRLRATLTLGGATLTGTF